MLTLPEVDLYRDYGRGDLVLYHEGFSASWEQIVKQVNEHNSRYASGAVDYMLRVFCPWDGELFVSPGFLGIFQQRGLA